MTETSAVERRRDVSLLSEALTLFNLAVPTIIIHLSFTVPPFLTASYVGRNFGPVHLDGYMLANLTGNLLTAALLQGLYIASDTLSPQAFGAQNYRELGLLAMRGFCSSLVIIVPMNVFLFFFMEDLLVSYAGQVQEAAAYAANFYKIYALCFPFYSLFMVTWKFLSAQNILAPIVGSTVFSCLVILPLCLEYFVHSVGFLGAALAITVFYIAEALLAILWVCVLHPHHAGTWPGFGAWREALQWEKLMAYVSLGLGGVLSSLEWVYWETIGLVAGTMGVIPMSAHAIPTQVVFLGYMFPLGLGIALAIRLGQMMSSNVARAKTLAIGTTVFSVSVFGLSSIALYQYRYWLYDIFTTEAKVIELCDQIWWHVCFYFFMLSVFGVIIGIAIALGMQWTLGTLTVVYLWVFGFPASYYFSIVEDFGLFAIWFCFWPPYLMINLSISIAFCLKDWEEVGRQIRLREGVENAQDDPALENLLLTEGRVADDGGGLLVPTRKESSEIAEQGKSDSENGRLQSEEDSSNLNSYGSTSTDVTAYS